jgi:hypothetical protein
MWEAKRLLAMHRHERLKANLQLRLEFLLAQRADLQARALGRCHEIQTVRLLVQCVDGAEHELVVDLDIWIWELKLQIGNGTC